MLRMRLKLGRLPGRPKACIKEKCILPPRLLHNHCINLSKSDVTGGITGGFHASMEANKGEADTV